MQVIALFHDTLEMKAEKTKIALEFGPEVMKGVRRRTRESGEPFDDYAARHCTTPK